MQVGGICSDMQVGGVCSVMQVEGACSNEQATAMASILTDIRKLLHNSNKQTSLETREFSAGGERHVSLRIIRSGNKKNYFCRS